MNAQLLVFSFVWLLFSCTKSMQPLPVPPTPGDLVNAPSFGYTPIDPLPVKLVVASNAVDAEKLRIQNGKLLNALPDETVRLAIGQFQGDGGIAFGPARIGVKGGSYVVILDYIKFTTESFPTAVTTQPDKNGYNQKLAQLTEEADPDVIVPVYIGIGLRLTANITVNEGSIDLGNLLALGVSAQAKQISGTLVIQTLGISGETVTGAIPLPSEINQTSVQNAIQSLGAIRATIYAEKTNINPRVVAVYNNLGGGQKTINGFISSLLKKPIPLSIN